MTCMSHKQEVNRPRRSKINIGQVLIQSLILKIVYLLLLCVNAFMDVLGKLKKMQIKNMEIQY